MLTYRLSSHGLNYPRFSSPGEVVRHFGCIQAQDIGQATWVIGSRIENSTEEMVKNACRDGSIVRTWPMRGTLHYMDPVNVKWMLGLCASKTLPGFVKRREFLGITDTHAEQALDIMDKELRGGKSLTRTELTDALRTGGIPMQTQWTYHLACYAASRGLICFGPPTEKEETFVLLDEWIGTSKSLNKDEQLATLARMYFRAHGPATLDDLAWWCGLGKTECKKGISLIQDELETIESEGKNYYHFPPQIDTELSGIRFIGGFDEYFLGYKDRTPVADIIHHGRLFSSNGIFFPLIIQDGKVIGVWKRSAKKNKILFQISILPGYTYKGDELENECKRYAQFSDYAEYEILL